MMLQMCRHPRSSVAGTTLHQPAKGLAEVEQQAANCKASEYSACQERRRNKASAIDSKHRVGTKQARSASVCVSPAKGHAHGWSQCRSQQLIDARSRLRTAHITH
jgi:hypothetical protein